MKHTETLSLAAVLYVPAIGLLLAAGCATHTPRHPPATAAPGRPAQDYFVGAEACGGCHKTEYQSHKRSNHAATARYTADIRNMALPNGALLGSRCRLRRVGGDLRVTVEDSPIGAETLKYALGSDKAGITFVAVTDKTALFEMRGSYFPNVRKWYRTPGHRNLDIDDMGLDFPPEVGRKCMGCHTTTLPADTIEPERKFMGVGCEACHGPGGRHIEAMRSGDTAHPAMNSLRLAGAAEINNLCGRCHRTEHDVMAGGPAMASETQRFQSYAIVKSRCFKESGERLSCVTCHDSHANASHDIRSYEGACLGCHDGKDSPQAANAQGKMCPVNPRSGCIPCHMPARKIIPNADGAPDAADHFIHVPQPKLQH